MRALPLFRLVALAALLTSCRSPTSVTLVLSSDVACADQPTTSVAVSRSDEETIAPSLVTQVCQPGGTIGTLVVVPAADKDENLRVRVVTSVGGATCEPGSYGAGCIVSRRQLRFIAHEELTMPIAQQVDCAGVACEATTTCRKGTCVVAQVDQDRCQANPAQCGTEIAPEPVPSTGGAGGESGSSGQGGAAGEAGMAGMGGSAGTAGAAGAAGSTGVVRPPLPPLPPGAGTGTTYYVSPSGDDTNDGKSQATPWKTLDKVAASTFGPGDSVLLEGGVPFVSCLTLDGNHITSTPEAPFTLGSYGGKPFQLTAGCATTALHLSSIDGILVTDGILRGMAGGTQFGIYVDNLGKNPSVLVHGTRIQKCDLSGFYIEDPKQDGAAIRLDGYNAGLDDVKILDNVLHGSDGPTSKDEVGINTLGNNRNITNLLVQGNEVYNLGTKPTGTTGTSGDGIIVNGVTGGTVQYNVVHHGGASAATCSGPRGIMTYGASNVTIQYNEVYAMGPAGGVVPAGACGWVAYDLDANTTGSVIQYNYAHDNTGPGFITYVAGTWSGNTIRYNVSQNDGGGIDLQGSNPATSDLVVHNNTVFARGSTAYGLRIAQQGTGTVAGRVVNNLLYGDLNAEAIRHEPWSTADVSGLAFLGNDYWSPGGVRILWQKASYDGLDAWSAATGQEVLAGKLVGLSVDPLLTSPGGGATYGGYDPGGLAAYRLLPGSPLRGAGLDLEAASGIDPGASDYFGAAIPHTTGTGFNIGADGGP